MAYEQFEETSTVTRLLLLSFKILGVLTVMMIAGSFGSAYSQKGVEITPYAGWMFAGSFPTNEGQVSLENDWNYGVIIDIPVRPDLSAELMYMRHEAPVTIDQRPEYIEMPLFNMGTQYFHAGAVYNEPINENITGFSAVTVGATTFTPKDDIYDTSTFFSIGIGFGVKMYPTEKIGLRLQGRLLLPLFFTGGSVWCGSGGCAAGVSGGTSLPQADLGLGLIFVL